MAKPVVDTSVCVGCGSCEAGCPAEAIKVSDDGVAVIDADACVECLACIDNCPAGAISEGEQFFCEGTLSPHAPRNAKAPTRLCRAGAFAFHEGSKV